MAGYQGANQNAGKVGGTAGSGAGGTYKGQASGRPAARRQQGGMPSGMPKAVRTNGLVLSRKGEDDVEITGLFADEGKSFAKVTASQKVMDVLSTLQVGDVLRLTGKPNEIITTGRTHSLSFRKNGAGRTEKGVSITGFFKDDGKETSSVRLKQKEIDTLGQLELQDKLYLFEVTPRD